MIFNIEEQKKWKQCLNEINERLSHILDTYPDCQTKKSNVLFIKRWWQKNKLL